MYLYISDLLPYLNNLVVIVNLSSHSWKWLKTVFIVSIKSLFASPQPRHFSIGRWLSAGKIPVFTVIFSFICSRWDHSEPQASPHVMRRVSKGDIFITNPSTATKQTQPNRPVNRTAIK